MKILVLGLKLNTYQTMENTHIQRIERELSPLRDKLIHHELYKNINSTQDLRIFMQHHVYAVWDFMSLAKFLQRELTCVEVPWVPVKDVVSARMINEIICGEETDVDRNGAPVSHFELYLQAMQSAGASTSQVSDFIDHIRDGLNPLGVARALNVHESIYTFLEYTFRVINEGKLHEVAAAFTWGREDLIPDMFTSIVKDVNNREAGRLDDFIYYLERHIELDADEHGPMAMKMIEKLCGQDENKWADCLNAANSALQTRLDLWNGIVENMVAKVS